MLAPLSILGPLAAHPVVALGLAGAGELLLAVEFCRPGAVLPGVGGLFLLLLGAYAVSQQPLRGWPAASVVLASAGVLAPWRWPQWARSMTLLSTVALCCGLACLPQRPDRLWLAASLAEGVVLGGTCGLLATVAGRARRAKRAIHGAPAGPAAAAKEHWE